jgi:Rod binding domain-containing protein
MKPLALMAPPGSVEISTAGSVKKPSPSAEAAQQFEQIFLRKMLSQMMQTAKLGSQSNVAGSGVYDSMVVDALAGSLSQKGGIGLAAIIEKRLERGLGTGNDDPTSEAGLPLGVGPATPMQGNTPPLPPPAVAERYMRELGDLGPVSAERLNQVLRNHSSPDPENRLSPLELNHPEPRVIRRTR